MTTSSRLYVRAARPGDREAVLRFCQHTWEWGDYIPQVWERWLGEPGGKLLVATLRGQPVALAHVVTVAQGETWLEGMRVAPALRQQGLATRLTQRCMREAAGLGAEVVRFATSALNTPVHRLAARLGFTRVAVFLPFQAEAMLENGLKLRHPAAPARPRLLSFLRRSPALTAMGGLYSTGWRFHRLGPEELGKRLEQGRVRVAAAPDGAPALAIVEPGSTWEGLVVSYADGPPEALTALALGLRVEAASHEPPRASARLPELSPVQEAFRRAGYQPAADHPFWVYQRALVLAGRRRISAPKH